MLLLSLPKVLKRLHPPQGAPQHRERGLCEVCAVHLPHETQGSHSKDRPGQKLA